GGDRTLWSYDYFSSGRGEAGFALPPEHADFFRRCVLWHQEGDYLFVHAGLNPDFLAENDLRYVLRRTRPMELLWNRTAGDLPHALGITIVYGHTPGPDFRVRWNAPFSIGIDTGAVYGGPLTALRLPDETLFQA
ncbi:MAG: hypothetical protein L0Y64_13175, partial [Myxococcaceae bacterium]|nr:hypothetical protein [Myxococcaceae bacterium]